jgi:hypothetical protein
MSDQDIGAGHRGNQPRPRRPPRDVFTRWKKSSVRRRRKCFDRRGHGCARNLRIDQNDFHCLGDFVHSSFVCAAPIRADEVKYVRARNAAKHDHTLDLQWSVDFAKNRNLLLFAICMVLFHFSNASLLRLVGQNLAHSRIAHGAAFMAGLIVVPQIIVAI